MSPMTTIANWLDFNSEQLACCEAYGKCFFVFSILEELFCLMNEKGGSAHLWAVIWLMKVTPKPELVEEAVTPL